VPGTVRNQNGVSPNGDEYINEINSLSNPVQEMRVNHHNPSFVTLFIFNVFGKVDNVKASTDFSEDGNRDEKSNFLHCWGMGTVLVRQSMVD